MKLRELIGDQKQLRCLSIVAHKKRQKPQQACDLFRCFFLEAHLMYKSLSHVSYIHNENQTGSHSVEC